MPIYEQTYKPWEARALLQWRWRPIMVQELRIAMTSRLFKFLMLLAFLPFLIFLVLVLSINSAMSNPDSLAGMVLEETQIIQVDDTFFLAIPPASARRWSCYLHSRWDQA